MLPALPGKNHGRQAGRPPTRDTREKWQTFQPRKPWLDCGCVCVCVIRGQRQTVNSFPPGFFLSPYFRVVLSPKSHCVCVCVCVVWLDFWFSIHSACTVTSNVAFYSLLLRLPFSLPVCRVTTVLWRNVCPACNGCLLSFFSFSLHHRHWTGKTLNKIT